MAGHHAGPGLFLEGQVKLGASDGAGLVVWNEDVTALETVTCADPTQTNQAATKAYADTKVPLNDPLEIGVRWGNQVLNSDGNGRVTVASVPANHVLVSLFYASGGNEIFCSLDQATRNTAVVWHAQTPSPWANASGIFRWLSVAGSV